MARFGEDAIIGNIDTGVWPESKSFSDEGMGPIPSKWKGICQNSEDSTFHCNRKLIGARYFNKEYGSVVGPVSFSLNTPRDTNGHSCYAADILVAFDMAIHDGVDVISVSIGSAPRPLFHNSVAIGSFHAVRHGIVVVCSGGNLGPKDGTISNVAPWVITVAASTMDRQFPSFLVLGNKIRYRGESLLTEALPPNKFFPIVSAAEARAADASVADALLCESGALDSEKAKGKILVCLRGMINSVFKGYEVAWVGGVGMVLVNDISTGNNTEAEAYGLPATHIDYTDGISILSYLENTQSPVAYITRPKTQLGTRPGPIVAVFSSKGPNTITPEFLKPDITAPGVSVISSSSGASEPKGQLCRARSETSMACPHISGVVGLLPSILPRAQLLLNQLS